MSSSLPTAVSDQDIDVLEALLFEDELVEDALDYFGVHGLICALVVGPVKISDDALTQWIFNAHQGLTAEQLLTAEDIVSRLRSGIVADLSSGSTLDLPIYAVEEEYYDDALTNWCSGFMEGFLENESRWFENNQELVAELLLPIMSLSQLFGDDEFSEIINNEKIMSQFEEQLPELMTDLFLFFHAESK